MPRMLKTASLRLLYDVLRRGLEREHDPGLYRAAVAELRMRNAILARRRRGITHNQREALAELETRRQEREWRAR
jgi:hypothetical protein